MRASATGDRRGDQPRPAADPGHRAGLRACCSSAINLAVDLCYVAAQSEAAPWLSRAPSSARRAASGSGSAAAGSAARCCSRRSSRRWLAPHDPLAQDLMLQTAAALLAARRRARLLARHRQPRPRPALAPDLRRRASRLIVAIVAASRPALSARCSGWSPASSAAGPTASSRASSTSGWRFRRCCCRSCWSPCSAPALCSVIIAIAIIDWTRFCRVVRAEAMQPARMDYVDSARIAGYGRIAHHAARSAAQCAAVDRRAVLARDGHRRHRRGDPVLRQSVDLDRRSDLGRHDRRGRGYRSIRPGGCWCSR